MTICLSPLGGEPSPLSELKVRQIENRPLSQKGGVKVVFRLKPRNDQFFIYFEQLADTAAEASNILKEYLEHPGNASQNLALINRVEECGDSIISELMFQINSSFLTPFDREDILQLAGGLNSIIDHIQDTMEKIIIYKTERPKDIYILKMTAVLVEAAEEIKSAVAKLSDIRSTHDELIRAGEKIRSLEQEGDYLSRTGIALLFKNTKNVVDIIKKKEIYTHLETTLDCCEKVSNILKEIAVKYD